MTDEKIPKEMFSLWKGSFDAYLKTLSAMQEQGEKMMDMMIEQADEVGNELKKTIKESAAQVKKMQQTYIEALKSNMGKLQEMMDKK